jgi:hypothetical protein
MPLKSSRAAVRNVCFRPHTNPWAQKAEPLGPISDFQPFSITWTEPPSGLQCGGPIAARKRTPLGTLRKAQSQIEPGVGCARAGDGRAGQAFALVESGMVDRATANSLLRTATGRKQGDQAAESKPPQEAARGFWIRAWGQREPALQGTGRSNDPARWLGLLEGGLDDPRHSRQSQRNSHRTPDPNVDVLHSDHSSVESGSFSFMR